MTDSDTSKSKAFAEHLDQMMICLSEAELEQAARASSYKYLVARVLFGRNNVALRDKSARAMAKRYLISKKKKQVALENMRATLRYRQEQRVDDLRLCFHETLLNNGGPDWRRANIDQESISRYEALRKDLRESLGKRVTYVQGYDCDGRGCWSGIVRLNQDWDPVKFERDMVYTIERALAVSERFNQESITVVLDYGNNRASTKSKDAAVPLLRTLRCHYVGRLHHIYTLDVSKLGRALWNLMKHFVGKATQEKIVLVSGEREKSDILGRLIHPSQATSWMLPSGNLAVDEFNLDRYLFKIPFDQAYSEAKEQY